MAEVLSPPAHTPSPAASSTHAKKMVPSPSSPTTETVPRTQPRSRLSASARSSTHRLSTLSRHTSQSRTASAVFPAFPSTLAYASVRDFAYPIFHQLHYGPSPETPSGNTTPGSEWSSSRRLSDPMDAWNSSRARGWGAGSWGGDGVMYTDPAGDDGEALPATSFGEDTDEDAGAGFPHNRRGKHRKSKSYTDISELERTRRHDGTANHSSTQRRSRVSGESDSSLFASSKLDPAGQDSLRQSRKYGRRDPRLSTTLPSRSFHTGQLPEPDADEDLLPLDAEQSAHAHSPQRASMGPEDELYAGESLALYSFEPENPNELRLREGQIILVSYRHGQGWLVAEDPETGEQGLVPEEYVRLVREIESWDPERGGFIDEESMLIDEAGDTGHKSSERSPGSEQQADETPQAEDETGGSPETPRVEDPNTEPQSKDVSELQGRPDSAHGKP